MSQPTSNILRLKDIIIDGRYKILQRKNIQKNKMEYFKVGRGSYGIVYKAVDTVSGKVKSGPFSLHCIIYCIKYVCS